MFNVVLFIAYFLTYYQTKMIPIMVLVISLFAEANVENSSLISSLADMLQKLCPGANVCPEKQSTEAPAVTFVPGFGSCCTDCSCGQHCENDGSCCFPKQQPNDQQPDDLTIEEEVACVFPTTASLNVYEQNLLRSYNMVSSVPKRVGNEKKSATNISCGEENVAPWGSLYPVYSAKRKRIYKNTVCAEAANVDDGELWGAKIYCKKTANNDGIVTSIDSFLLGIDSNSVHPNCRVDFIFPGDVEEIRPLICYLDPIDTCNRSDILVPIWINASTDEIIQACKSGLLSPYRRTTPYKNVFCQICNTDTSNSFFRDALCLVPHELESRNENMAFIGLIDVRVLEKSSKKLVEVKQVKLRACSHRFLEGQKDDVCRTVFCPSGQLRDGKGKCTYLEKFWFNQEYIVDLLLTADENINMSEVFQVKRGQLSVTAPNLISPWHNGWSIESLYSDNFYGTKGETNIAVILKNNIKKVRPGQVVKYIEEKVNQKWFLIHNNVTQVLESRMMRYNIKRERVLQDRYRENESSIGNYASTYLKQDYYHLYDTFKLIGNWHLINKLYLCDQVELAQSEFNLSLENAVLFNTLTDQILLDGEFTLISSNTFEGYHARICVNDSGLVISDQYTFSYGSIPFKIYCNWLFVLVVSISSVFLNEF